MQKKKILGVIAALLAGAAAISITACKGNPKSPNGPSAAGGEVFEEEPAESPKEENGSKEEPLEPPKEENGSEEEPAEPPKEDDSKEEPSKVVKYKVNYFGGNGLTVTGAAPAESEHVKGEIFTLESNPFGCAEHVFAGWVYGEKVYQPNDEFTMPEEDVTFTAKWLELFSVVYRWEGDKKPAEAADGAELPANETVLNGNEMILPEMEASAGYLFSGWRLGETQEVMAGGTAFAVKENVTLTAQWKKAIVITFSVGEHALAGETVSPIFADREGKVTLPKPPNAETGYEFDGWKVGEEETKRAAGDEITVYADTSATAVWTERAYNVIYDCGGYATAPAKETAKYKSEVDLSETEPVAENGDYRFAGWEVTLGGEPVESGNGKFIMPAGDVTITAKWEHDHKWDMGACTLCTEVCTHVFDFKGECQTCDLKRGEENMDGCSVADFNAGRIQNKDDAKVVSELKKGAGVIFRGVTLGAYETVYDGIAIQIWEWDGEPLYVNECVFLQGNGERLEGSWSQVSPCEVIAGLNSQPLDALRECESEYYSYEIAVSFINETVTIAYKAWADYDMSGTPDCTGVVICGQVKEESLAVAFVPYGATLDDIVEVGSVQYIKK